MLLNQVAAIGPDRVGVLQHLQPLEMIFMIHPHAGADDFQKIHDAERSIALVRAQFAMIGMAALGRQSAFPLGRTTSAIGGNSEVSALREFFAV